MHSKGKTYHPVLAGIPGPARDAVVEVDVHRGMTCSRRPGKEGGILVLVGK